MATPRAIVLVVEPEHHTAEMLRLILGDAGYAVRCASTLDEVEPRVNDQRPDLVLTEVRLPDTMPFAVLSQLDADPATRRLPVLLCTAAIDDLLREPYWRSRERTGAITKPFDIDKLLDCIAHLLDGKTPDTDPLLVAQS